MNYEKLWKKLKKELANQRIRHFFDDHRLAVTLGEILIIMKTMEQEVEE